MAMIPPMTDRADGERPGYFESSWPAALILGSFFVLTVPLCLVASGLEGSGKGWTLGVVYLCALGMTHFVVTLTLYLQADNLRHFLSSRANRFTYFGVPAAIFLAFDLYHALGIAATFPLADCLVRLAIRLVDFQHFGRQSFGVLQLFRKRSACPFPSWATKAEGHHFRALAVLMLLTYASGGVFRADGAALLAMVAIVVGLLLANLVAFAIAWRDGGRGRALMAPLAYFLLQTASAGLAAWNTAFYGFALAMHYVEYHVLMVPRCFHTRLDGASRTDRAFGRLRRHRVLFYGLILSIAVAITRLTWLGMVALMRVDEGPGSVSYRLLISAFDGLFVFHYFIESKVWKFGDPYYRQSLLPLYFRGVAGRPVGAGPHPRPAREESPVADRADPSRQDG